MLFKLSLLRHMLGVREALAGHEAETSVDVANLMLTVRLQGREWRMRPQFLVRIDGQERYTTEMNKHAYGFVGWLPYFNRRWEAAADKLLFKHYCAEHGLATPRWWASHDPEARDVVVKQARSSFGRGLRGPFRAPGDAEPASLLQPGEYYERFVEGELLKAWFWNGEPVCLELKKMVRLTGNGQWTIRDIAERIAHNPNAQDWSAFETTLRYGGYQLDDPLPANTQVLTDFRLNSPLYHRHFGYTNVLAQHRGTPLEAQLKAAGATLQQSIPEQIRADTLFTLDGVVDAESKAWFLEMNCNPAVHPDCYPAIIASSVLARKPELV